MNRKLLCRLQIFYNIVPQVSGARKETVFVKFSFDWGTRKLNWWHRKGFVTSLFKF